MPTLVPNDKPVASGVPIPPVIDKQMLADASLRVLNCLGQAGHVQLADRLTSLCRVTRVDDNLWDAVSRHKLGPNNNSCLVFNPIPVASNVPVPSPIDKQMPADVILRAINCVGQAGHVQLADRLTSLCRVTRVDELLWDAVSRYKMEGLRQRTRLMYAVKIGDVERATFLCKRAADVNISVLLEAFNAPVERMEACIEVLLAANPEVLMTVDMYGKLPLHHACEKGVSPNVVSLLLDAYSEAASQKTHINFHVVGLPLHIACEINAPLDVIKVLLAAYPKAAEIPTRNDRNEGINNGGMLPLHRV